MDTLATDLYSENWTVRRALALHCNKKELDILVNDSNWIVRRTVARRGMQSHLETLAHDTDQDVRRTVARVMQSKANQNKQKKGNKMSNLVFISGCYKKLMTTNLLKSEHYIVEQMINWVNFEKLDYEFTLNHNVTMSSIDDDVISVVVYSKLDNVYYSMLFVKTGN